MFIIDTFNLGSPLGEKSGLAALEALVHFDTDIIPNDLTLLAVEIPLEVSHVFTPDAYETNAAVGRSERRGSMSPHSSSKEALACTGLYTVITTPYDSSEGWRRPFLEEPAPACRPIMVGRAPSALMEVAAIDIVLLLFDLPCFGELTVLRSFPLRGKEHLIFLETGRFVAPLRWAARRDSTRPIRAYAILLAHGQGHARSSGEVPTICRARTSGAVNDGELFRAGTVLRHRPMSGPLSVRLLGHYGWGGCGECHGLGWIAHRPGAIRPTAGSR